MKKHIYALLLACFAGLTCANAQSYCTPSILYASSGCSAYSIGADSFKVIGTTGYLRDTLHCTGTGYVVDTSTYCSFTWGSSYVATIGSHSFYSMSCQAWIDFNNNGTFESSESVGGKSSFTGVDTFLITIPSSGSGTIFSRLRIALTYTGSGYSYPTLDPCMSGYTYGEARDYAVSVYGGGSTSGCSGTPTGGSAMCSTYVYCAFHGVALNNIGCSSGSGYTYQWQSSTDRTTWTTISGGAAASAYTVEPSVTTYYRCMVSCPSSGTSSYSNMDSVVMDRIYGHISFSSMAPDTLNLKVWLVDYNTSAGTLYAVDSIITCLDSSLAYYEFNGMGSGSGVYLVKAMSLDVTSSVTGASGYVPTYGGSSPTWSGATNVSHTAGTSDSLHITMAYGTVPAGSGFIGGSISSGAGKGTASDIPAAGMEVLLKNTTSGVITYTYTNSTGNYMFSNLANGTYVIYPEKLGDSTITITVTLSTSAPSVTNANFKEYTTSKIIKPVTTSVSIPAAELAFSVAPNPAHNSINLTWNHLTNGAAEVSVIDITGRTVLSSVIDINGASGSATINVSDLASGLYHLQIKSAGVNYNQKVSIQH